MDYERLPERIDEQKLGQLALEAARTGNYSDRDLGELVRIMVKKLMLTDEFRLFTEDWVPEMVSAAYVSVFNAMRRLDLGKYASPYNYLYTTARNAIRKEANRLKRRHDRETPEFGIGEFAPSDKRRALSHVPPVSKAEERDLVKMAAVHRRQGSLACAINKAFKRFSRELKESGEQIGSLARMIRERRESWKKTTA